MLGRRQITLVRRQSSSRREKGSCRVACLRTLGCAFSVARGFFLLFNFYLSQGLEALLQHFFVLSHLLNFKAKVV